MLALVGGVIVIYYFYNRHRGNRNVVKSTRNDKDNKITEKLKVKPAPKKRHLQMGSELSDESSINSKDDSSSDSQVQTPVVKKREPDLSESQQQRQKTPEVPRKIETPPEKQAKKVEILQPYRVPPSQYLNSFPKPNPPTNFPNGPLSTSVWPGATILPKGK